MDTFELKREQTRLGRKVELQDNFTKLKTIAGVDCTVLGNKLIACVVVCAFPTMEIIEKQIYTLNDPLPYKPGFQAYREMSAMIEAINQLEEDPDLIIVSGAGINHPRKFGIASHLGLSINSPTIGVTEKLPFGKIEQGKIVNYGDILGFEIKTREHANPIYISPGQMITLGSTLNIVKETIREPHKLPEPLHLARKIAKKTVRKSKE